MSKTKKNQLEDETLIPQIKSSSDHVLADPVIIFLAGGFVGFTLGEQLFNASRDLLKARASQIAIEILEAFLEDLRSRQQPHSNTVKAA